MLALQRIAGNAAVAAWLAPGAKTGQGRDVSVSWLNSAAILDLQRLAGNASVKALLSSDRGPASPAVALRRRTDPVNLRSIPANAQACLVQRGNNEEEFGTAKTSAPIASSAGRPQAVMAAELKSEVELFKRAEPILTWIETRSAEAGKPTFTAEELFGDKAAMKKLRPKPKTAGDLKPILDLLVFYGVLQSSGAGSATFTVVRDAKTGQADTARLLKAKTEITKFTEAFKKRVAKKDPLEPVVETELMPTEWSSSPKAVKEEEKAKDALAALKARLDEHIVILSPLGKTLRKPILRATSSEPTAVKEVAGKVIEWEISVAGKKKPVRFKGPFEIIERIRDGSNPATERERERIKKEISKAEAVVKKSGRYRTFAKDVVTLMGRLRERNQAWTAGTYVGHSWGEFSIDIFIRADFDKKATGFWNRGTVRTFFDDLNTAAEEEDDKAGKFAWRALYNDDPLAAEINKKYGANRVINVLHHGPHPDKLHIHLDVAPVDLKRDEVTGYDVKDGRVVIRESR